MINSPLKRLTQSHQPHFSSFLVQSILFHGFLFSLMLINVFFFTEHKINYIPAIKVDLVALPDKRPPRRSAVVTKTPPKAAKTPPKIQKTSPKQPKQRPQPLQVKAQKVKPQKKSEVTEPSLVYDKHLQEVGQTAIERLKHLKQIESMVEKQEVIKGNRLASGTDIKGLDKLDYDNYVGQLHQHIQSHWELPQWLAVSDELSTVVRVYLDVNGYVTRRELIESSGDVRFDQIVLSAIDAASPFPKPEDKFINIVRSGITLIAKP